MDKEAFEIRYAQHWRENETLKGLVDDGNLDAVRAYLRAEHNLTEAEVDAYCEHLQRIFAEPGPRSSKVRLMIVVVGVAALTALIGYLI